MLPCRSLSSDQTIVNATRFCLRFCAFFRPIRSRATFNAVLMKLFTRNIVTHSDNFYCLFTPRIQCSQNDKKNNYLTARAVSPTCQLKSSVEADIVSIKRQVRDLKTKVDDILNLLKTPKNGNKVVVSWSNAASVDSTFMCAGSTFSHHLKRWRKRRSKSRFFLHCFMHIKTGKPYVVILWPNTQPLNPQKFRDFL